MNLASHTRIIDLSNDFRLTYDAQFQNKTFVYGLPELYKQQIKNAQYIANPGCFATAIQLALLPLAMAGLLKNDVHINAITVVLVLVLDFRLLLISVGVITILVGINLLLINI